MAKASTKARSQSRTAAKMAVPAAGSGHRGLGKPSSNAHPTGSVKMPTAGKHSVTTRQQPTNRTPASSKSVAANW